MKQINSEVKGNQWNKKGKMLLLFNKINKGCILDKSRKVIIEVIKYKVVLSQKGVFYFLITSEHFKKSSVVKCILSIILFQSLIDLT